MKDADVPDEPLRHKRGRTLPIGYQWLGHDRPNGAAAARRVRQLEARGLRFCRVCEAWLPVATTSFQMDEQERFVCQPCVEANAAVEESDGPDGSGAAPVVRHDGVLAPESAERA